MTNLIRLRPHIEEKIWGGKMLGEHFCQENRSIGEIWNISTLPSGSSLTSEGKVLPFELKYLVKLIDTSDFLSIQVHPDDIYAQKHSLGQGKTECWLILDDPNLEKYPQAGIYLGFQEGVRKEDFFQLLTEGKDITKFLNFYQVKKGDFFFVPAGAIHAIGPGITLAEVQQSSGITFRVWDWNRLDKKGHPRDLHVTQAKEVLNFSPDFNKKLHTSQKKQIFGNKMPWEVLVNHHCFQVSLSFAENNQEVHLPSDKNRTSFLVLNGKIKIGNDIIADKFDSFITSIPNVDIKYTSEGESLVLVVH